MNILFFFIQKSRFFHYNIIGDSMKKLLKIITIILIIAFSLFLFRSIKNYKIHKILTDNYVTKYNINNLYNSKEINYRLVLDQKQKKIYEIAIENLIEFKSSFMIPMDDYNYDKSAMYYNKFSDIMNNIFLDHPELIYVTSATMSFNQATKTLTVSPIYTMSKKEYQENLNQIYSSIQQVKSATSKMNEYEKIKYVYDYIGKNNSYGNPDDYMAHSAYAAFNHTLSPVCEGYARAVQILFNNIGINSLLVSGQAEYALFLGGGHSWNYVEIENKYYLFDVTWSSGLDEEEFYNGFLSTPKKHKPENKKTIPYISKKYP